MNCDREIMWKILFLEFFAVVSISKCQIPASGSDIPSLSSIHWGMSIQEVKDRIGRSTEEVGDSTLTSLDSFLNSSVQVVLTFGKADSEKGLKLVEVQFDEKNAEKLRSYLKNRYGENYEIEKKEKTKLFFTVNFEASKWVMKNENVVMIMFSQGDQVLALSLLYRRVKK
jgi:hypothetical protein